ncbi:hypothetical protein C8Q73DRAFT_794984 [Cubamyces lactineus]|nr:hypothetical protein C8Q73DRAFT_794984 [Cubamyces lactineus]
MLLRTVHSFELDAKIRVIFQGGWNDYADELSEDEDKGKDVPPGMPYTICDLDPRFDEGGIIETTIQYALEEPNFGGVHWIGSKPWGSNAETATGETTNNRSWSAGTPQEEGVVVEENGVQLAVKNDEEDEGEEDEDEDEEEEEELEDQLYTVDYY